MFCRHSLLLDEWIYVHIFQQIREILPNIPIIADIPLFNSYTLEQIGKVANGIVGPATLVDDETIKIPEAEVFIKRYKSKYNKRADFNGGLGYDMFKIAAVGVMNAKDDGTTVINYIKNQKNFKEKKLKRIRIKMAYYCKAVSRIIDNVIQSR